MMPEGSIAGVLLSGGRSRRMGGGMKAHKLLAGKPLISHVIDRIEPQVSRLVLSVESVSEQFAPYGLEQVADPEPGGRGPLGGLLSALQNMEPSCDWLLLVPCDAPFLPGDLAVRLQQCAVETGQAGCVVRYQGEVQPTFSIWHRSLLPVLESAVLNKGMGGFKQFLDSKPLAILDWEASDISPFFNINDSGALAEAYRMIKQELVNY